MKLVCLSRLLAATALLTCASVAAQGSQSVIGGGCPNRSAPTVSGSLTTNSVMSIDDVGCFTAQGGFAVVFFGNRLPKSQWIPIKLSASIVGPAQCDVVLLPAIGVSAPKGSLAVKIPNDPNLQGLSVSLQTFCRECGFAGCYELLTQGVEVTIG